MERTGRENMQNSSQLGTVEFRIKSQTLRLWVCTLKLSVQSKKKKIMMLMQQRADGPWK